MICRFWQQGTCREGSSCRYKHIDAKDSTRPSKLTIQRECKNWKELGQCSYGSRCKYSHSGSNHNSDGERRYSFESHDTRDRSGSKESCRFFARGRCTYGSQCRWSHDTSGKPRFRKPSTDEPPSFFTPSFPRQTSNITMADLANNDFLDKAPTFLRTVSNISMGTDDMPDDHLPSLTKQISTISMTDGEADIDSLTKALQKTKIRPPVPLFSDSSSSRDDVRNPNPNIGTTVICKNFASESKCNKCGSIGTVYKQGDILSAIRLCWRCCPCLHCGSNTGAVCAAGLCDTCYTPFIGSRLR